MEKISVIIPIYNAEQYLVQCMDSILTQTYQNLEIILIDDGSPDNCGVICDNYATGDKRIKVIHQLNAGVSSARNLGLDHVSGKYILFVDADDYLPENAIEQYCRYLDENADWYIGNYITYGSGCKDRSSKIYEVTKSTRFVEFFNKISFTYHYPWGKLYRAEIIDRHNIRYDVDLDWSEDFLFNLQYLCHVKSVILIPDLVYMYSYNNQGSLSRKRRPNVWRIRYNWYIKYRNLLEISPVLGNVYPPEQALLDQIFLAVTYGAQYPYKEAHGIISEILSNQEAAAELSRLHNVKLKQRILFFLLRHRLIALGIFYCKFGRNAKKIIVSMYSKRRCER